MSQSPATPRSPRARGDRIAVVSPPACSREEFDAASRSSRVSASSRCTDEAVFAARRVSRAGPPSCARAAFMRAWPDPRRAALIAVRGGYGSVQLLPLLDRGPWPRHPKLFIGYSDNTSLLSWLTCQCGMTALHGPMLDGRLSRGQRGYDESSFVALLQGGARAGRWRPMACWCCETGEAAGPLFGGTLTQLAASLGTPYAFDPPAGLRAVPRGRQRAAVPDRPHADAAAAERHPGARAWRSCSARCAAATSRAAGSPRATSIAAATRRVRRPVLSGFPRATRRGPAGRCRSACAFACVTDAAAGAHRRGIAR